MTGGRLCCLMGLLHPTLRSSGSGAGAERVGVEVVIGRRHNHRVSWVRFNLLTVAVAALPQMANARQPLCAYNHVMPYVQQVPANLAAFGWRFYDQISPSEQDLARVGLFEVGAESDQKLPVIATRSAAGHYAIAPTDPLTAGATYRLEVLDLCVGGGTLSQTYLAAEPAPLPESLGELSVRETRQAEGLGPDGVYHQLFLNWSPPSAVAAWRDVLDFHYIDDLNQAAVVGTLPRTPFRVIDCEDDGSGRLVNGKEYRFHIAAYLPGGQLVATTNSVEGTPTVDCPVLDGCQAGKSQRSPEPPWLVLVAGLLLVATTRRRRV